VIPAHANGSARRSDVKRSASTGLLLPEREPFEAVLDLGRRASRAIAFGLVAALLFHGTAAARTIALPLEFMRWSRDVGQRIHDRLWETYDIDVFKAPPEPESPPPPPPEEAKPEPKEAPPPVARAAPKDEPPPPPPAAAQAGAVLTKAPDPNEPVDLTGGFVTGTGSSYAGGVTEQNGTSESAVYDRNARAGGVPGGRGTAAAAPPPPPPGPNLAREARLSGSSEWKCPWPSEADAEQIDEAYVSVQVVTRADGTAERVTVLTDPGHGFAREARLCALREHYSAALDHDGNPIPGVTKAFKIHFER
jgi:periplasmic protein TonB